MLNRIFQMSFFQTNFWIIRAVFIYALYVDIPRYHHLRPQFIGLSLSLWIAAGIILSAFKKIELRSRGYAAAILDFIPAFMLTILLPGPGAAYTYLLPLLDAAIADAALFNAIGFIGLLQIVAFEGFSKPMILFFSPLQGKFVSYLFCLFFSHHLLLINSHRRSGKMLLSLIDAGQSMASARRFDEIVRHLEKVLSPSYRYNAFVLYLIDRSTQIANVKINRSPLISAFPDFSLQEKSCYVDVIESGKPMLISDTRSVRDRLVPSLRSIRSMAILPLRAGDETTGLFILTSPSCGYFYPEDLTILQILANQTASAVKNVLAHEEANSLATTDGLTGLCTQSHFKRIIHETIPAQVDPFRPVSMIMMDLDQFKEINDTFGHLAGDQVVSAAARVIKNFLSTNAVVARYGGDEFIAMVRMNKTIAALTADRIRQSIAELHLPGLNTRITMSAGVASFPEDGGTPETLIASADKALYQAKRTGKNRVCVASMPSQPLIK